MKRLFFFFSIALSLALFAGRFFFAESLSFSEWDDEGYMLVSIRDYMRGVPIFSGFYTQYGPAAFQLRSLVIQLFGLSASNDMARMTSLVFFSLGLLGFVLFLRRNVRLWSTLLLGVFALGQLLMAAVTEPGHPQDLGVMLLSLVLLVLFEAKEPRNSLVTGVAIALIALIKVNLGIFLFLSLCLLLLSECRPSQFQIVIRRCLECFAIVLPSVLMHSRINEMWVRNFAILSTVQIILVLHCGARSERFGSASQLVRTATSAFCAAFAILSIEIFRGSALGALLDGIVLRHLDYPAQVTREALFPSDSLFLCIASMLLFLVERRWSDGMIKPFLLIRFLASVWILSGALGLGAEVLLPYGIPLIWILAQSGEENSSRRVYRFLALLSCLYALQAFPVGGTQVAIGSIPLVLLATCALDETLRELVPERRWFILTPVVWAAFFFQAKHLTTLIDCYASRSSLALPGASLLRPPPEQAARLQEIARELGQYETFISDPGKNSFYLWTGREPPTHHNAGAWRVLLTTREQEEILAAVRGKKVAVLRDPARTDFWSGSKPIDSVLAKYIDETCVVVKRIGRQEIRECRG